MRQLKYPIVIDGRNLYEPDAMAARGFTYYSVGRQAGHSAGSSACDQFVFVIPLPSSTRKIKKS